MSMIEDTREWLRELAEEQMSRFEDDVAKLFREVGTKIGGFSAVAEYAAYLQPDDFDKEAFASWLSIKHGSQDLSSGEPPEVIDLMGALSITIQQQCVDISPVKEIYFSEVVLQKTDEDGVVEFLDDFVTTEAHIYSWLEAAYRVLRRRERDE